MFFILFEMNQQYMGQWDIVMRLEKWGDALVNNDPPKACGCYIKVCEILAIMSNSIISY